MGNNLYMRSHTINNIASMPLAELYANPTARYNGELIDKDLKLVERRERPADYKYGDVNADATPLLFVGAIATIGLAAIVPSFLAVGDTAKRQQEEFEEENTKKGGFKPRFGKKPISGVKVGERKKAANALQKGGKGKGSKDIEEPAKKKGLFGR